MNLHCGWTYITLTFLYKKISTLQFSFKLWTYLFCPYKFCRSCTLREVTCKWLLNLFLEFFIILLILFSSRLLPIFRCLNITADFNFFIHCETLSLATHQISPPYCLSICHLSFSVLKYVCPLFILCPIRY